MANDCYFHMSIRGTKENVETFYKWLGATYDYTDGKCEVHYEGAPIDHHIGYRVFEVYDLDGTDSPAFEDNTVLAYTFGYCAWSVYSCMLDGEHTYTKDNRIDIPQNKSLTIMEASRLLKLDIEIFSEEPGCAFSEHYIIRHGEIELDDTCELVYHESEDGEWWYTSDHQDADGDYLWEMD